MNGEDARREAEARLQTARGARALDKPVDTLLTALKPPFRLSGVETLDAALVEAFRALYLDNWHDVRDELHRFIENNYVPRALYEAARRGQPTREGPKLEGTMN